VISEEEINGEKEATNGKRKAILQDRDDETTQNLDLHHGETCQNVTNGIEGKMGHLVQILLGKA
jgi:hypothetical protein